MDREGPENEPEKDRMAQATVQRAGAGPEDLRAEIATSAIPARASFANDRERLVIVTDAWRPQINGVARTYEWLARELPALGVTFSFVTPEGFPTVGLPTYRQIRLALASPAAVARSIDAARPSTVHIATEGPLGLLARRHCLRTGLPFTTCYHTRYPEYAAARFPLPLSWSYAALRRFHRAARATMVATPELKAELASRGFEHLAIWRRGVDVGTFALGPAAVLPFQRPYFLYAGRLAVEKNVEAFLALDLPGTKIVAGDGPQRAELQRRFPDARFLGALGSSTLGALYRAADVFVFPSRTDTFGLVMAEALAAGTPVAAYPSAGAHAIFGGHKCGVLDEDLRKAALEALDISRDVARAAGAEHSMTKSVRIFLAILEAARIA